MAHLHSPLDEDALDADTVKRSFSLYQQFFPTVSEFPLRRVSAGLVEDLSRQRQPHPDSGQDLLCHLWQSSTIVELVILCSSDPGVEGSTAKGPIRMRD